MNPHETIYQQPTGTELRSWRDWMDHPNMPSLDAALNPATGWYPARQVTQVVGDGLGPALAADQAVSAALNENDRAVAMSKLYHSPVTALVTVIEMARRQVGFPLTTGDDKTYLNSVAFFADGLCCCPLLIKQVWDTGTEWYSDNPDASIADFILSRHDYHPTLADQIKTRMAEIFKPGAGFISFNFYAQTVATADQPWIEIASSKSWKDPAGLYRNGQDDWYKTFSSCSYAKLSLDPDWRQQTEILAALLEKRRAMMGDWLDEN